MTMLQPREGTDAPPDVTRSLRRVLGHYATGVTVVTTVDATGGPVGLTVNSFTSVSLRPPMVLWCLNRASGSRAAFERSRHFAVNILTAEQRPLADRFASSEPDRFAEVGWQLGVAGQPILDGVGAWLVCRAQGSGIPAGDHVVLFGKVLAHRADSADPLLFAHGEYHRLTD
jgi:flavin reductase (DIM6/NTAB) family NADH-FMN oxidoreductase RutF